MWKFYCFILSTNSIHTFRNNFPVDQTNGFDVITSNLNNPADIFYNQLSNTLAIPNSGNNTVDFSITKVI